jgi:hypothetical protein
MWRSELHLENRNLHLFYKLWKKLFVENYIVLLYYFIYKHEFQNLDSLEEYLKYFAYNAPYLSKSF